MSMELGWRGRTFCLLLLTAWCTHTSGGEVGMSEDREKEELMA